MAGHVSRGWERQKGNWFGEQFEMIALTQEGMVSGSGEKEEAVCANQSFISCLPVSE